MLFPSPLRVPCFSTFLIESIFIYFSVRRELHSMDREARRKPWKNKTLNVLLTKWKRAIGTATAAAWLSFSKSNKFSARGTRMCGRNLDTQRENFQQHLTYIYLYLNWNSAFISFCFPHSCFMRLITYYNELFGKTFSSTCNRFGHPREGESAEGVNTCLVDKHRPSLNNDKVNEKCYHWMISSAINRWKRK